MWINPVYLLYYASSPDNSANSTLFVIYGLLCYIVGTLVLLWRMVLGFYHFSYDDEDAGETGSIFSGLLNRLRRAGRTPSDWPADAANAAPQAIVEGDEPRKRLQDDTP